MRYAVLVTKGIFYLACIAVASPLLWWLGRSGDSFEGDVSVGYDDDDLGTDVDTVEDEDNDEG